MKEVEEQLKTKDDWTPRELTKMADYILAPEMKENNPYRNSKKEFPVLSNHQVQRRKAREVSYEELNNGHR